MKFIISVGGVIIFALSVLMIIFEGKNINVRDFKVELEGSEAVSQDGRSYIYSNRTILSNSIAYAQGSLFQFDANRLDRVKVEAEKSVYNMKKGEIELIGNVRLTSERIYMEAKRAKVFLREGKIAKIEGEGDVYIKDEVREAKSRKIIILPEEKKAVLTGDPEILQGKVKIKGRTITFHIGSDEVEVRDLEAEM